MTEIKTTNSEVEIKAYFIDLDGTLLDTKNKNGTKAISQANLDALQEARKAGKAIIVSTGRALDAKRWLEQVNSPYAVLSNGAIIVVKDKVVRHLKLTIRDLLLIHEFAWKNNLAFKIDADPIAFGALTWFQKFIAKKCGFLPVNHYNFEMHKEHTKVVIWGKTKNKMAKLITKLQVILPNVAIVTSTHGYTIEVTHIDATKGKGDEFIATNYLNLSKDQTMHIGDTMNDSTAVGHVGKLVALANADKNLKALTQYRGPHYKNGGVAKVLKGEIKTVNK